MSTGGRAVDGVRAGGAGGIALAAGLTLSACAMSRGIPPAVAGVWLSSAPGGAVVEIDQLVNRAGGAMIVCLDDVVIAPVEGGPSCAFARASQCFVVHGDSRAQGLHFDLPGTCKVNATGARILADMRWRPWLSDLPWQYATVVAAPRVGFAAPLVLQPAR